MSDEPTVAGVSLALYAAVHAAVSEGFPLEVVLQHEGLDMQGWSRADAAWAEQFMASVDGDHTLVDEYDRRVLQAQERFRRRVSPIDEDLAAWLDLLRGMSAAEDPRGFLADLRLPQNDLIRVHRRWGERFEAEDEVRKKAAEILQREPGPVPPLELEPAKLPPPVRERQPVPLPVPDTQAAVLPPLLADLPQPDDAAPPVVARQSYVPPVKNDEPSAVRVDAPPAAAPPVSARAPLGPAAPSAPPGKLTLMTYACLCAELAVFPDQQERAFAKFGLSDPSVRAAEMQWWRGRLEQNPEDRADYEAEYARFVRHWRPAR